MASSSKDDKNNNSNKRTKTDKLIDDEALKLVVNRHVLERRSVTLSESLANINLEQIRLLSNGSNPGNQPVAVFDLGGYTSENDPILHDDNGPHWVKSFAEACSEREKTLFPFLKFLKDNRLLDMNEMVKFVGWLQGTQNTMLRSTSATEVPTGTVVRAVGRGTNQHDDTEIQSYCSDYSGGHLYGTHNNDAVAFTYTGTPTLGHNPFKTVKRVTPGSSNNNCPFRSLIPMKPRQATMVALKDPPPVQLFVPSPKRDSKDMKPLDVPSSSDVHTLSPRPPSNRFFKGTTKTEDKPLCRGDIKEKKDLALEGGSPKSPSSSSYSYSSGSSGFPPAMFSSIKQGKVSNAKRDEHKDDNSSAASSKDSDMDGVTYTDPITGSTQKSSYAKDGKAKNSSGLHKQPPKSRSTYSAKKSESAGQEGVESLAGTNSYTEDSFLVKDKKSDNSDDSYKPNSEEESSESSSESKTIDSRKESFTERFQDDYGTEEYNTSDLDGSDSRNNNSGDQNMKEDPDNKKQASIKRYLKKN